MTRHEIRMAGLEHGLLMAGHRGREMPLKASPINRVASFVIRHSSFGFYPGSFTSNRCVQLPQHPRNGGPGLSLFRLRVSVELPAVSDDELLEPLSFVRSG